MDRLDKIFDICYGSQLDLNKCDVCGKNEGYNFVNRSNTNCGVSSRILKVNNKKPFKAGSITTAMGGSVLASFVQQEDFYTGQNVKVLVPKEEMSLAEKLYYCHCIESNRFRFSTFGREANYSFNSILVPSRDEIPNEIKSRKVKLNFKRTPLSSNKLELKTEDWKWFRVGEIFDCNTTKHAIQQELSFGEMPFVTRSAENNGVSGYVEATNCIINKSNCITIGAEGIFAFYQPNDFVTGVKVYTLRQISLNPYNAIFICTLLNKEVYRYNYGNARILEKIKREKLKLPAIKNAKGEYEPDWQWMEDYIKGLPYSGCL